MRCRGRMITLAIIVVYPNLTPRAVAYVNTSVSGLEGIAGGTNSVDAALSSARVNWWIGTHVIRGEQLKCTAAS